MPTQKEIDLAAIGKTVPNIQRTEERMFRPMQSNAVPLDNGMGQSNPVAPTVFGQGIVGNAKDTGGGKTELSNVYGISTPTAVNAADKLSQVAGYNATETLYDPSRKTELSSLTNQYQEQAKKPAITPGTVTPVGGQPAPVQNASTGTPAAATTTLTPEQTLAAEKNKLASTKEAKDLYYYNQQTQLKKDALAAEQAQQSSALIRQYDNAIATQQNRMANDAANAGVILGTQGAARSARAQQAVSAMNQQNKDLYTSMVISKDRAQMELADQFKRANDQLDLTYKQNVSQAQDDMLKKLQAMNATGEMNSKQGLQVARSYLESVLDTTIAAQEQYVSGLQAGYDQYKAYAADRKDKGEVAGDFTKQMNDGFVYNKYGEKVTTTDENGNQTYLSYTPTKEGKFLSMTELPDGSKGAMMQMPDGSVQFSPIKGYNVSQLDPTQIDAYASAYASGKLPDSMLSKLPQDTQAKIMQAAVTKGFSGDLKPYEVEVDGKKKTMLFNQATGEFTNPSKYFAEPKPGEVHTDQVGIDPEGGVHFQPEAEKILKDAGYRTSLLALPDGTARGTSGKRDLGQCGAFANDVIGKASTFGNLIDQKPTNSDVPKVGSAVVFDTGSPNGHVGIVVGVDEVGQKIIVKSSNLDGDGKITTDTYPMSNKTIKGYYDPMSDKDSFSGQFEPADIQVFNSATPTAQGKLLNDPKFREFNKKKKEVMDNKDSSLSDILEYSRGGKDIAVTQAQSLEKYQSTLSKLEDITKQISTQTTGPIIGRLRGMNPYDTPAQTLKATLQSLIPGLARGVYGEVGVLTDSDIANYAKTIPNLASTEATNKAVLAMTLDTLAGGYKRQLATLAKSGVDVSGLTSTYEELKAQADAARSEIGLESGTDVKSEAPAYNQFF